LNVVAVMQIIRFTPYFAYPEVGNLQLCGYSGIRVRVQVRKTFSLQNQYHRFSLVSSHLHMLALFERYSLEIVAACNMSSSISSSAGTLLLSAPV